MTFDLDKLVNVELTTEETRALARLSSNKDFDTLADILGRWQLQRVANLLSSAHDGQDAELLRHQGGWQLLKRMLQYVNKETD